MDVESRRRNDKRKNYRLVVPIILKIKDKSKRKALTCPV